ncbi:MAG TPA: PEP-CTERM sorting domain-containing protein [Fibrobacteria bacterium]|nr:PEP-CTERM sorting domain-containing protein [Fibrobacteria bacterium]
MVKSFASVLILAVSSMAAPMYYTFSGVVISSDYDGIGAGKNVSYTFRADLDETGYVNHGVLGSDYADDAPNFDYFLTDYLSGDAIPTDYIGAGVIDYHLGADVESTHFTSIYGSNSDLSGYDFLNLTTGNGLLFELLVGQQVDGLNFGGSAIDNTLGATVYSDLILTYKSDQALGAVPEPTTLVIFGSGLLVLGLLSRKVNKA